MTRFICRQCGTQYAESETPPFGCAICLDDRQYVRWTGQDWATLDDLRRGHAQKFTEEGEGITGIGCTLRSPSTSARCCCSQRRGMCSGTATQF